MGYERYSVEQWAEWIEEQEDSGLSVAEFCDAIGVSAQSFYQQRAKRAETRPGLLPQFVPVSVVNSATVEIDLPCGAVVQVPEDAAVIRTKSTASPHLANERDRRNS